MTACKLSPGCCIILHIDRDHEVQSVCAGALFRGLAQQPGEKVDEDVLEFIATHHASPMMAVGTAPQAQYLHQRVKRSPTAATLIGMTDDVILNVVPIQVTSGRHAADCMVCSAMP